MTMLRALGSGLVGACVVTLLNECARRFVPNAPRLDLLGMRAIEKSLRAVNQEPPPEDELRGIALAGDLLSNSLYYSLVGMSGGKSTWLCGALLGASAGIGAITLPGPLGLGRDASERTPATQAMTVAWYLAGGLAAAAAYFLMPSDDEG